MSYAYSAEGNAVPGVIVTGSEVCQSRKTSEIDAVTERALVPPELSEVVPVPVYLEPQFVPVPYGYSRGFIDGHAVVYNKSGFILDIAAVF